MVPVEHANEAGSQLVRVTGLWEGTTRLGDPYFSGRLSDTSRLLIFRAGEQDAYDWIVFITSQATRGPLIRVGELHDRTSRKGEHYLSGSWGCARLLIFSNTLRTRPAEPSHVAYFAPTDPPRLPSTPSPLASPQGQTLAAAPAEEKPSPPCE
jgi:hypothetical protein